LATVVFALGGCATEELAANPGSMLPEGGKADLSAETESILCRASGFPEDCDLCAEHEWYADGECDLCKTPDADCDVMLGPLEVRLRNFEMQVGARFELRVESRRQGEEWTSNLTDHRVVDVVEVDAEGTFVVNVGELIHPNRPYDVSWSVDTNGNDLYDPLPVDDAWKALGLTASADGGLVIESGSGEPVGDVDFAKLGDFSVLFDGFSPGFGMRLVDERTGEEVHRRIASASDDGVDRVYFYDTSFLLSVRELVDLDATYTLELYSDTNENGAYDPPPVDAAWRREGLAPKLRTGSLQVFHESDDRDVVDIDFR